ncbi:hypothetical protein IAD21_02122 [Abditibacteriota bacterium]|nr:hypothetical protein IAD21_02122 [Abditibacteriota bacterium]
MKSVISLQGALRVEYRIQLKSLGEATSLISSEHRLAGGTGAVAALTLASLGAHVRLSGNPIGDDSHGRFLISQLQNVPGLELDIETRSDVVTPYAILVREQDGTTRTHLSPEAAQLEGPQDYSAILAALRKALILWNGATGDNSFIERLINAYDEGFGSHSLEES